MYRLNEEQKALIAKLSQIADEKIAPNAADVDANARFPEESMQALADGGFYGLTVPKEFGGLGEGLPMTVAAVDEIAQRCASTAMVYLMHLCGVAAYSSNPQAASRYLTDAARGAHLSTLAWSERGSRSHFWAPMSQAVRENGHIKLNAVKSWVTSAGKANGYVATARAVGAESPMAITLYVVEGEDQGLRIEQAWDAMGMRGNASAPMLFEDLKLDPSRALTADGEAMGTMMGQVLPTFALGNAACSIGVSEASVKSTQQHLLNSKFQHLGQNLADLPNLRERLAKMRIRTDQARAHLSMTLDALSNSDPAAMLYVLSSKAQAADAALEVTDLGMRACGGAAFSKHLNMERLFRDARAMNVMAPTSDVLHDFVGKALLGQELF